MHILPATHAFADIEYKIVNAHTHCWLLTSIGYLYGPLHLQVYLIKTNMLQKYSYLSQQIYKLIFNSKDLRDLLKGNNQ